MKLELAVVPGGLTEELRLLDIGEQFYQELKVFTALYFLPHFGMLQPYS